MSQSSTAMSSYCPTPSSVLSDGDIPSDDEDAVEEGDSLALPISLPSSTLTRTTSPHPADSLDGKEGHITDDSDEGDELAEMDGEEEGGEGEEGDTPGLSVSELTSAQLREMQSEVSASLTAKASLSSLHSTPRPFPLRAISASPTPSLSSLQAQLASQETDLLIAATLGTALSDRNEYLDKCIQDLGRRLAALDPPTSASPTSAETSSDSLEADEVSRIRIQLNRALHRQQMTESHYKEALATAKQSRRDAVERGRTSQHNARRRETQLTAQLQGLEEDVRRLGEENERLKGVEGERLTRERQWRRSLESKERGEEEERRRWKEEKEELDRALDELDRRYREEHRRREEAERRCGVLERQKEEVNGALHELTMELERRKRRWEELDKARGKSTEEAVERERQHAAALMEQCKGMEEKIQQLLEEREKRKEEDRPPFTSPSHHLISASASPPSVSSSFLSPSTLPHLSNATQTPLEWEGKGESASVSERVRVYPTPLHFTLVSPGPDSSPFSQSASPSLTPRTVSPSPSPTPSMESDVQIALVPVLSAETTMTAFTRRLSEDMAAQEASPEPPLPMSLPSSEVIESDHRALEAMLHFSSNVQWEDRTANESVPLPSVTAVTPKKAVSSLSAYVASPLSYLQPQLFKGQITAGRPPQVNGLTERTTSVSPSPASTALFTLQTKQPSLIRGLLSSTSSPPLLPLKSTLLPAPQGHRRQSSLLRSSTSSEVRQAFSTLLHTRLGLGARVGDSVRSAQVALPSG